MILRAFVHWFFELIGVREKIDPRFPREVIGHWYCGSWYMYLATLRDAGEYHGTSLNPDEIVSPAEGEVAFNPFRTGHARDDTSGLYKGLIPAIQIGGRVGLYEQVGGKYRESAFYDGAPWDDGYRIDLRLVRTVSAEAFYGGDVPIEANRNTCVYE